MQASIGRYSRRVRPRGRPTRTEHAPQSPSAQTTLVPTRRSSSRRYSASVEKTAGAVDAATLAVEVEDEVIAHSGGSSTRSLPGSPTINSSMPVDRFTLRSRRVLLPEGVVAADVIVDGERIAGVEPWPAARRPAASRTSATSCSCPGWSTSTSTSTSRAAPSGRASRTRPAPPRPAASRRSSTCRSTATR